MNESVNTEFQVKKCIVVIVKGGERSRSCLYQHHTLMKIYYNVHYTTIVFISSVCAGDESILGFLVSSFGISIISRRKHVFS